VRALTNLRGFGSLTFSRNTLRVVLVCTLVLLVVVSGTLSVTPLPTVHACDACNFLLTWGSSGSGNGQFSHPDGIAVDASGNVYVVDISNNRVEKFSSTGTYITQWGSPGTGNRQFNTPIGVAVDSLGNVYVTDANNERVQKFTSTGNYVTQWGHLGNQNGNFSGPRGVAVDSFGNVYVVDIDNNRVQKFTGTGNFITKWGSPGTGNSEFNAPIGVAVDSSGNVYVADYGNNRVQKFTSTGNFITKWGSPGTGNSEFSAPVGVAVDSSGNVYVTDANNNRVQKFTSTGNFITKWGSPGTGNSEFNAPFGVAVDASGNVYVTEFLNNRVELFGDSVSATFSLVAGWNLISLPVVPLNTAITKVLNDLIVTHNLTIVWSYQGGAWKSFTPPSTGTLTSMVDGFGYWIYITHTRTLYVLGYVIRPASTPPAYSLSKGWNLLGFKPQPSIANETVHDYLASISGKYDVNSVWIYNNTSTLWTRAHDSTWLVPTQAMWIMVDSTAVTLKP